MTEIDAVDYKAARTCCDFRHAAEKHWPLT